MQLVSQCMTSFILGDGNISSKVDSFVSSYAVLTRKSYNGSRCGRAGVSRSVLASLFWNGVHVSGTDCDGCLMPLIYVLLVC